MKKEHCIFSTVTSEEPGRMRQFSGVLVKGGFTTLEEAEAYLYDNPNPDIRIHHFIIPIYYRQ